MTEKRFEKNDKIYIGIIASLIVFVGVLVWQVFDQKTFIDSVVVQQGQLEEEKDNLTDELQEMLAEYDQLETENEELTEEMIAQKNEIKDLLNDIEKNKNNTRLMYKYKKEVGSLRTIMVSYVVTIDSLNTLNQNLSEENFHIRGELGSARTKFNRLTTEKSKLEDRISRGAILTALNLEGSGIRVRTNGRQTTTWRSGRTEMVRTCFTLDENKVTEPGDKDIFLRVIKPDGSVLLEEGATNETNTFVAENETMIFSSMRSINYQNTKQDGCVYCEINTDLAAGEYQVELYEAKRLIGVTTFKLR
jgi:FtsZ-binding cell division protein ZapB